MVVTTSPACRAATSSCAPKSAIRPSSTTSNPSAWKRAASLSCPTCRQGSSMKSTNVPRMPNAVIARLRGRAPHGQVALRSRTAAAVALFRQGVAEGFHPGERLLYIVLWVMPFAGMVLNRLGIPIVPLVILLFGVIAWSRMQSGPGANCRRPQRSCHRARGTPALKRSEGSHRRLPRA